jgi:hypothetical protein
MIALSGLQPSLDCAGTAPRHGEQFINMKAADINNLLFIQLLYLQHYLPE